ncbi:MAG: nuclease-related domain-containing protein [Candidatus Poseidonia sp.]|nr:nuclease-related domain-containing protein [Poseidonia sp.]
MGWLANYRWLSSLDNQNLPPVNHAKQAATKAELKVAKQLRKMKHVLEVHHAVRLTKIEGGRSRREVDLIAVMADRILLIEVKNFKGSITMNEQGVLHQNGASRNWTFAKLDDASKRLKDTMGLTGIQLGATEVHSVLLFKGSGQVDESVTTGKRLLDAHVAKSMNELKGILERPLGDEATMSKDLLKAVRTFFGHCGTWDAVMANNGVEVDGDVRSMPLTDQWRTQYQEIRFKNLRSWWSTLFFGPKFVGETKGWDGQKGTIDVSPEETIAFVGPGSKGDSFRLDHLRSLFFGYHSMPDWQKMVLMKTKQPAQSKQVSDASNPATAARNQPPYRIGVVVKSATVSGIHEQLGIFFTLDAKNSGLYRKEKMEEIEWSMRETFYRVGEAMHVEVVKVKRKGKSGWNIEVKSVD